MQAPSLSLLDQNGLENTPLSDGADNTRIARYIRAASFAIVGNCVLCILYHSKRSKEAMTSTDLISESRSQASYSSFIVNCVVKTATHMHIIVHVHLSNAVQCV